MMVHSCRQQVIFHSAFSLLEVLISLAIIGGVLVTIVSVINYHVLIGVRYRDLSQVIFIAQEKLYGEGSSLSRKGMLQVSPQEYSWQTSMTKSEYEGILIKEVTVRKGKVSFTAREYVPE